MNAYSDPACTMSSRLFAPEGFGMAPTLEQSLWALDDFVKAAESCYAHSLV